jgi:hypothetical protein
LRLDELIEQASASHIGGVGRASQREKQHGGSVPMSERCQEQIQMITMVIGKATPNAPPIINANADSRFASACTSCPDMPLLHRAPAPQARWMCMVNKELTRSKQACSTTLKSRSAFHLTIRYFLARLRGVGAVSPGYSARMIPILSSIVSPPCSATSINA